jgi:hypothetical protein
MIKGITTAIPYLNIRKTPSKESMKVGVYKPLTKIEVLEIVDGWGRSDKGWFSMRWVMTDTAVGTTSYPTNDTLPSPQINKPFELYRTLHGTERPDTYYLGVNYGSFDVASQLLPLPKYGNKPPGIILNASQVNYIKAINGNDVQKWHWLVDEAGTRKVLAGNEAGRIWIPVPICSGGNVVAVVEIKDEFARILTVPADRPIPDNLPPYLCHLWYGVASLEKGGKIFIPAGGVYYPLLAEGSSAWVPLNGLVKTSSLPPVPDKPEPDPVPVDYSAPEAFELYRTLHGTERPENYYLGVNLGSFDVASLLLSFPGYDNQPAGFVLSDQQVKYIKAVNGDIPSKWNWLVDEEGTTKILAEQADGSIYLPTPICPGGNVVAVVETKGEFARILTFPREKSIPNNLPDYLLHTWYGITMGGKIFIPKDGVRYPLLAEGSSAWVPLSGLVKTSSLPPVPDKPEPDPVPVDYSALEAFELYRTLYGTERPENYYLGVNWGSFDVASLLLSFPGYDNQPAGFVLSDQQVKYIKAVNGDIPSKWNWLVDEEGTTKILAEQADGSIYLPIPICPGGNVVAVVETKGEFARILTFPREKPIPNNLPDYLLHTWYGITKGGKIFIPKDGVRYPLLAEGSSAWVPLSGLVKTSSLPPVPDKPEPDPVPVDYSAPEAFELYRTLYGTERPENYYLGVNLGSFDVASLLLSFPGYDNQPAGFVLSDQQVKYIKAVNGDIPSKWNWLVDEEGTGKIFVGQADGSIYLPTPICPGGNVVAVVETKGEFARILTVSRKNPIPNNLPDYLLHKWYGITMGGKIFIPKDGVRYPLLAEGSSAWVPLSGLVKV